MQSGDSGLLPLTSMLEKLVRDRRICRDGLTLKQRQNRGWTGNDSKACPWAIEQEADDRHPLRDFVSDVVRATGLKRQSLIDAADRGFTDAVDIVDALKRCDADGTTARLAVKLHRETPEVTERVFGWPIVADSNRAREMTPMQAVDSQHIERLRTAVIQTAQVDDKLTPDDSPNAQESPGALKEIPVGFEGGSVLADLLGIHPTRRGAFFRHLERKRKQLGDDNCKDVANPGPNKPKFYYRMESEAVRSIAKKYAEPKPT